MPGPDKKPGAKASHCGLTLKDFKWKNTKSVLCGAQLSKPVVSDLSPVSKVLFDELRRC